MGFGVVWNTSVVMGHESVMEEGIAWATVEGPSGSFGVNGGGWAFAKKVGTSDYSSGPLPLPVYSRPAPNPEYPNYWFVGVPCPDDCEVAIRAWGLFWEAD